MLCHKHKPCEPTKRARTHTILSARGLGGAGPVLLRGYPRTGSLTIVYVSGGTVSVSVGMGAVLSWMRGSTSRGCQSAFRCWQCRGICHAPATVWKPRVKHPPASHGASGLCKAARDRTGMERQSEALGGVTWTIRSVGAPSPRILRMTNSPSILAPYLLPTWESRSAASSSAVGRQWSRRSATVPWL